MNIVFLNPSGQMGGAEAVLVDILVTLREVEPEWTLELIVSAEGTLAAKARALGVITTVLPFPRSLARLGDAAVGNQVGNSTPRWQLLRSLLIANPGILGYVSGLRKLLRQRKPDIVHTNGFKMHVLGAMAKPRGVPLIWHVHDYVQSRPLMSGLLRLLRNRCSIAVVNSNSVGDDLKAACGDGLQVQTIYNGIDTAVFCPTGDQLDLDSLSQLPAANAGTIRIGLLATFARWKGHEVFLRALSLVAQQIPVRGYIIGDALYQTDGSQTSSTELKSIAQRLGISARVGFTGFVAEPAAAMRSLDIVVHASTQPEPFGLVIAESMACGRPTVVSQAGGAAEVIHTNGHGPSTPSVKKAVALSYQPGNAEQLAKRIMQLASDPQLRSRLGEAGRASVVQRFNRTKMTQELLSIYRRVSRCSIHN